MPTRPSTGRARAAVLVSVHLLAAFHIYWWWTRGTAISPVEPSEAMAFSKDGIVNAGLIFFVATGLATLVFGRFFCGWGCHMVALQDGSLHLLRRLGITPRPARARPLLVVPLVAFAYMYLWPPVDRLLRGQPLPTIHVEMQTSAFWETFPGPVVAALTFLVCGFAIVYFLGAKGFCTYACPYGALYGTLDRLAPLRIRVTDACNSCGLCSAQCTSNVDVAREVAEHGMVVDPGCMKTLDCVAVCPNDALHLGFGTNATGHAPAADPQTWSFADRILLLALFALAYFAFHSLYGAVPFLFALGLSAIAAYLGWVTIRLLQGKTVHLGHSTLRAKGKLTGGGRVFAWLAAVGIAFWVHSGYIQLQGWQRTQALRSDSPIEDARTHVEKIRRWGLALDPRNEYEGAWIDLVASLSSRGGHAEAASLRSIAKDPRYRTTDLHFNSGLVRSMEGRFDEAEAHYRAALDLDPDLVPVIENLAGLLCQRGRFDEGIRHFERAVELSPRDPETRELLARAYRAVGRSAAADEMKATADRMRRDR